MLIFVALLLAAATPADAAKKGFPKRDITNIVVWAAGGGTDVCNRIVSAEMSKILGVNINVVNKTGGVEGSVGMADAFNALIPPSIDDLDLDLANSCWFFTTALLLFVLPLLFLIVNSF